MASKDKLREAQKRAAEQRDRARAARLAATGSRAPRSRGAPPATLTDTRPSARATAPPLLLSRADLATHYGINYSRSYLWKLVAAGKFPAPFAFGPEPYARKGWNRQDIENWLSSLEYADYGAPDAAA